MVSRSADLERVDIPRQKLPPEDSVGRPSETTEAGPSILYEGTGSRTAAEWPADSIVFHDLNLDQVMASIIRKKDAYNLQPYLLQPLTEIGGIAYRQEVFTDLEDPSVYDALSGFAKADLVAKFTYRVRDLQQDDLGYNHYHRERFFLNAVEHYCGTIVRLESQLASLAVRSRALLALRAYLSAYVASSSFCALREEGDRLEAMLDEVRYCVLVKGDRITVGAFDDEDDYSKEVAQTFERFRQGEVEEHLPEFREDAFAGAGVLDLVAKVFPGLFRELDAFCKAHLDYLDNTVRLLDRELQFYLSYREYIEPLRKVGLRFTTPTLSTTSKHERVDGTYDLALAARLTIDGKPVVPNSFLLSEKERIIVVSGPNNGGKTTLARTFGQLHYLARLGVPLPGREAQLFVCDRIHTHFEREEQVATLVGKLQGELNRLRQDLDESTTSSVFILNEMFNSTSTQDALFLGSEILERISELDALCICVTFLDELASFNEKVTSMVSTVDPADPATRTYKVVRRAADGRAYARAIADKYGLTFEQLTARLQQ